MPHRSNRHRAARGPRVDVVLCLAAASSCQADSSGDFWARHADSKTWSAGASRFADDSAQWLAPAVLTVATPIVWVADKDVSEDSISQNVFNSNTKYGDQLAIGFVAVPILLGGWRAFDGDARFFEVSIESLTATMAMTYGLKSVINKERPDGTSEDSFPSGHTSAAFAGATLLHRLAGEAYGDPWWSWFLYAPAAYVGISRLEGNRHFLSDILFGAALGIGVTNIVFDAHEPTDRRRESLQVRWFPWATNEGAGVGLDVSF